MQERERLVFDKMGRDGDYEQQAGMPQQNIQHGSVVLTPNVQSNGRV